MIIEIIIFLVTFVVGFFLYTHWKIKRHFSESGLKYMSGVPVFGNVLESTLTRRHLLDDIDAVYKAFPNERYVGYIEATQPIILVRDPELIKTITVRDFDHFVDHKQFFHEDVEPLFGGSIFMMKGDKWRDMRTTLSPAFTGSKMRHMMNFMTEISQNIVDYLKDQPLDEIDMGDLIRRYTNDVIASAAFGLQINSLQDKQNEFYKLGQGMFKFTAMQRILMFVSAVYPSVVKALGLKIFPEYTMTFFKNIVKSTIEYREQNGVERPDMIQLLMEASKGTLKTEKVEKDNVGFATVDEALTPRSSTRKWTLTELAGQVFIFFFAGFESSASGLVLAIHELAINPDIKEKLYQEIKDFKENKGALTYDNIADLKYLDCVMNETFRKWAAALIMDRVCTKPYELPPPREGGKPYKLKPGDVVYNVVNSIHKDPQYFPDPEKFDPERFSDENKHNIRSFTFMPFGMGPRNCIGSRFALLELKVLLYNLVLNFDILKCPKTCDPIILQADDFNLKSQGSTWVKLEPRN